MQARPHCCCNVFSPLDVRLEQCPSYRSLHLMVNPRPVKLAGQRVALGRSATNDLSFPEDNGLSRQHLCLNGMAPGGAWLMSAVKTARS